MSMRIDWILSDTHIGHKKLVEGQRSDMGTVEYMNDYIINQWNNHIKDKDNVMVLGDFIMGDDESLVHKVLNRLNFGSLNLVIGNHDTPAKIRAYMKYEGITSRRINLMSVYAHTICNDYKLIFTHVPIHDEVLKESSRNGQLKIGNVHGHVHFPTKISDLHYNVNWDLERKIYKFGDVVDDMWNRYLSKVCKEYYGNVL